MLVLGMGPSCYMLKTGLSLGGDERLLSDLWPKAVMLCCVLFTEGGNSLGAYSVGTNSLMVRLIYLISFRSRLRRIGETDSAVRCDLATFDRDIRDGIAVGGRLGGLPFLTGLSLGFFSLTTFNSVFLTLVRFLRLRKIECTLAESYTSLALKASRFTFLVLEIVLILLLEGRDTCGDVHAPC